MKKVIMVLAATVIVLASTAVFAASGSALIPHWAVLLSGSTVYVNSYYTISNITDTDAVVTLYLYNRNNNNGAPNVFADSTSSVSEGVVKGDAESLNYVEGNGATATFTLAPFATTTISLANTGTMNYSGYGRIEWSQQSHNTMALIMTGFRRYQFLPTTGASDLAIVINGGKAF